MQRTWILDLDDTLAHTTRDMWGDPSRVSHLTLVDGTREFLDETKARGDHRVLVTMGEWPLQMAKIQLLGLTVDRTSIIPVARLPEEPDFWSQEKPTEKWDIFRRLAEAEEHKDILKVLVGDRLDRDIAPGNKLGLTTVRMRLPEGRYSYLEPQNLEETPDFTVANFFELMQLPFFTEN